ncbi:glycosyltransferase family 4 protein [Spirosoma arcticum]
MPQLFLDTERMANLTSGIGQVCLNLGRELIRQRPPGWEVTFLVSPEQVGLFGDSAAYITATRWRQVWHPWKFDVWHCLYQNSRYLPKRSTSFIYTILDLNYLQLPNYSVSRKARKKVRYQRLINQAAAITTISDYVAQDICQQMTVTPDKRIDVIYLGINSPADLETISPSVRPDKPFLFFVGMLQPYKNVHTMLPLLEAYPAYQLVLAGPDQPAYSETIRKQARQMGVDERLVFTGIIDEPTKWWLYAHCDAFLFPSLHEGFGLPVIEAMALGKPVFCSTLTSLPEVGGSEAFYFLSFEPDAVVETFRQGMNAYRSDPAMSDRLRQRSQQFNWETTAAQYWRLYQDVLSG